MRALSFFLVFIVSVVGVVATGGGPSSSAPVVQPYEGHYDLVMARSGSTRQAKTRLQDHLRSAFQVPADVKLVRPVEMTADKLRANLNQNRNLRRFLYLGHSNPGSLDMVIATPVHTTPYRGSLAWALLGARQPNTLTHYGLVEVTHGVQVLQRLRQSRGPPQGRALETGQVLTIQELFEELSLLQSPNWRG